MLANRTGIFLSLSALHQSTFMDFIYSWLESARAQGESGSAAASTDLFCGANWFNLGDESTGLPGTVLPKPCALEMTAETACPRGFPSAVDAQSSARRGQDEAEGAHGAGLQPLHLQGRQRVSGGIRARRSQQESSSAACQGR